MELTCGMRDAGTHVKGVVTTYVMVQNQGGMLVLVRCLRKSHVTLVLKAKRRLKPKPEFGLERKGYAEEQNGYCGLFGAKIPMGTLESVSRTALPLILFFFSTISVVGGWSYCYGVGHTPPHGFLWFLRGLPMWLVFVRFLWFRGFPL